jgi:hypothetical protein
MRWKAVYRSLALLRAGNLVTNPRAFGLQSLHYPAHEETRATLAQRFPHAGRK